MVTKAGLTLIVVHTQIDKFLLLFFVQNEYFVL